MFTGPRDVQNPHLAYRDRYVGGLLAGTGSELLGLGKPECRIDWMLEHRSWLWPDVRLDFEEHGYLQPLYEDEHPEIVISKAAQMGASEFALSDALWAADVKGANVLYLLPQASDVLDFSTTRVGLALEASEYLGSIVQPEIVGDAYHSQARDRQTLKRIRNRFLYLRHGSVKADGRAPHRLDAGTS